MEETLMINHQPINDLIKQYDEVRKVSTGHGLFDLTPQVAFLGFLGFLNIDPELLLIQNHLLLIFKIYIYNSRKSESLKIKSLLREITKFKNTEEKISLDNEKKTC